MRGLLKNRAATLALLSGLAMVGATAPASASLTTFQTFVGSFGVATSGWGSTTQSGTISTTVPAGSTVVAAYLYSSLFGQAGSGAPGGNLGGTAVNYANALGINAVAGLQAYRADVTSIVAPVVGSGGGTYNFPITETNGSQDGEALVVVYSNGALPTQTVGILDGFSASGGDNTSINFASALHPGDAGFTAQMIIGDGFSFDGAGCTASSQVSTITVNGGAAGNLTSVAGCNDSSVDASPSNGNLITVGDFNSPTTPTGDTVTATDHEHYDLTPFITDGDTSISIHTVNASGDDNIFLATFLISGKGGVNAPPPDTSSGVPEPLTLSLFGAGLAGAAAMRRRRKV